MITLDKFRPINSYLLVKKDEQEEGNLVERSSGLLLVQHEDYREKRRDTLATVVKVGDYIFDKKGNRHNLKDIFSPGDRIWYYNPAGNNKIEIEGKEYILLRAEDVDCKVED